MDTITRILLHISAGIVMLGIGSMLLFVSYCKLSTNSNRGIDFSRRGRNSLRWGVLGEFLVFLLAGIVVGLLQRLFQRLVPNVFDVLLRLFRISGYASLWINGIVTELVLLLLFLLLSQRLKLMRQPVDGIFFAAFLLIGYSIVHSFYMSLPGGWLLFLRLGSFRVLGGIGFSVMWSVPLGEIITLRTNRLSLSPFSFFRMHTARIPIPEYIREVSNVPFFNRVLILCAGFGLAGLYSGGSLFFYSIGVPVLPELSTVPGIIMFIIMINYCTGSSYQKRIHGQFARFDHSIVYRNRSYRINQDLTARGA